MSFSHPTVVDFLKKLKLNNQYFGEVFLCPSCGCEIYWQRWDTYVSGWPRLVEDIGNAFEDDPDHECSSFVGGTVREALDEVDKER